MNIEQFKAEHPEAYAAAVNAGVQKERDRVATWMVFNDVDPTAVKAGIESGNEMSGAAQAELNRKAFAKNNLSAIEKESVPNIETGTTTTPTAKSDEKATFEANKAALLAELGLGKK
jgi:CCR4-NOT transcriptional regulation complex NOT5 subunit